MSTYQSLYTANSQNIVTLFETPLITYTDIGGYKYTKTDNLGNLPTLECLFLDNAWLCEWGVLAQYNPQPHPSVDLQRDKPGLFQTLNQQFWGSLPGDPFAKVVYVVGHVGIGKTTALQHYFIEYCRNMHPEEYDRKCPVYIDLMFEDQKDIRRQVFASLRNAITAWYNCSQDRSLLRKAFDGQRQKSSYTTDYEHLFLKVNSDMVSEESWEKMSFEERDTQTRHLLNRITSDEDWWWMFSRYFEARPKECLRRDDLEYLVLIVDNVDQAGYNALEEAIRVIRRILRESKRIWRVYVSVWESLFYHMVSNPDPHLMGNVVYLKDPDVPAVLAARAKQFQNQTWTGGVDTDHNGCVYHSTGAVAHFIYQTTALALLRSARPHITGAYSGRRPWYASLAGGTLRMALGLTALAMQASSLEILIKRELRENDYHHDLDYVRRFVLLRRCVRIAIGIRRYPLVDSLLCGSDGYYSNNHRYIPNVVHLSDDLKDSINIVLGPNLCDAIAKLEKRTTSPGQMVMTRAALCEEMLMRGFDEAEVRKAYNLFIEKRVLQTCHPDKSLFVALPGRAVALRDIISDPAYLDNVAQIQWQGFNPVRTVSTNNSEFLKRSHNTLDFIEMVGVHERKSNVSSEYDGAHIPIVRVMNNAMRDRISALKRGWLKGKWLREITPDDWIGIEARIEAIEAASHLSYHLDIE